MYIYICILPLQYIIKNNNGSRTNFHLVSGRSGKMRRKITLANFLISNRRRGGGKKKKTKRKGKKKKKNWPYALHQPNYSPRSDFPLHVALDK